jgi:hypothetical protein
MSPFHGVEWILLVMIVVAAMFFSPTATCCCSLQTKAKTGITAEMDSYVYTRWKEGAVLGHFQ